MAVGAVGAAPGLTTLLLSWHLPTQTETASRIRARQRKTRIFRVAGATPPAATST